MHGFWSSQLIVAPVHRPTAQLSPVVQALPSLQTSALGACVQVCSVGWQASSVQRFLSSQTTSSVSPLQSLSMPSHSSVADGEAVHALKPVAVQERTPGHEPPVATAALHVVANFCVVALASHGHWMCAAPSGKRAHCLADLPSMLVTSLQP